MREKGRLARFKSHDVDPALSYGLGASHPAIVEGRTLFPTTVVGTYQSPRFLVSAKNSSKIGREIEKGPWAGMPVYTLTLEERSTCPRSCHVWQECFGNAMPWARRNDAHHPDFIPALKAEVITLIREVCSPVPNKPEKKVPRGLVVRLHVLGDFFSVEYVKAWAGLMEKFPELHVFGYTARGMFPADGDMSIATAIRELNERFPERWVIRWSSDAPGPGRTVVVDEDPHLPDVIVCPAETKATETCSTCALCWNQAAWPKTIAFLRHGMKRSGGGQPTVERGPSSRIIEGRERLHEAMKSVADAQGFVRTSLTELAGIAGCSFGTARGRVAELVEARVAQLVKAGGRRITSVYRVFDAPQEEFPPLPPLPAPTKSAVRYVPTGRDRIPKADATPVVERKPNEPLVQRAHGHSKGGWGRPQVGTADQYDIGTPAERIAAVGEEEKARIAARYGVAFKKEPS